MVSIYLLNTAENCINFASTVLLESMWRVTTWDKIILLLLALPSPGSTCARQTKDGQKAGTFLYQNGVHSCSCRDVSVRVLGSVFWPQLTVAFGCLRCYCRTDIFSAGDVHSHRSSPCQCKVPAVVLCTFSPWNRSLTRKAAFFNSSLLFSLLVMSLSPKIKTGSWNAKTPCIKGS